MKYKVGDRVILLSISPNEDDLEEGMFRYLGKTMTINQVVFNESYCMEEDGGQYEWYDEDILGLMENCISTNPSGLRVNMVENPPHYTQGKYEVIDVIEDWQLSFHEANVVKYVARAKFKGNEFQDLKKARFYLDRKITNLEK